MTPPPVPTARLARRLFWPYRGRLAFLAVCIALGVGSIFAIANLVHLLGDGLYRDARTLMGADITVSSWRPLTADLEPRLQAAAGTPLRSVRTVQMATMAGKGDDPPFLVTLQAVEPGYPLYGKLAPDAATDALLFAPGPPPILVSPEVATQRRVAVGDTLRIGDTAFTVAGQLAPEPSGGLSGALGFAPRVVIPLTALDGTGLVQFGSRVQHALHFALGEPDAPEARTRAATLEALFEAVAGEGVRVRTFVDARDNTREIFERVALFFTLVALVTLILGAIGVVVGLLSFLNDQLDAVATLRCMGVGPGAIRRAFLLLFTILALSGGAIGVMLGLGADAAVLSALEGRMELEASLAATVPALLEALAVALGVGLVLNLVSLRRLGALPPHALFGGGRVRLRRRDVALLGALGLAGLSALLLARDVSPERTAAFTGGLLVALLGAAALIGLAFAVLSWLHRRLGGRSSDAAALRHGVLLVLRQRGRSTTWLLALGLGIGLTGALHLVQSSLSGALAVGAGSKPNVFLVDVQSDQIATVQRLADAHGATETQLSPLVRARLTHINGAGTDALTEQRQGRGERARLMRREYNLTYADGLGPGQKLVAGELWAPGSDAPVLSLEQRFATRLGVRLGDWLRFDVQGRPIELQVTSLRRVDWLSLSPNFFVVTPPGVLGEAPQTAIGALKLDDPQAVAAFQRDLFAEHANITVLDLAPVLSQADALLGELGRALELLALVCAAVGLLILWATLDLGRGEREARVATLRALGWDARGLKLMRLAEQATLGVVAAALAVPLALGVARPVLTQMNLDLAAAGPGLVVIALAPLLLPWLTSVTHGLARGRR